MPGTQALPLFALTVLVVNATPGVDLLMTLTKTLQQGVRGGVAAAAGIAAGCGLHTLAAAFGLAALVAASAEAFAVLKGIGAAYLLWVAVELWRQAWPAAGRRAVEASPAAGAGEPATVEAADVGDVSKAKASGATDPRRPAAPVPAPSPSFAALSRTFRQALVANLLNPKIALFFLALLPQFIDARAPSKTLAFLVLGGWFVVQGFVFLAVFAACVAPLRRRAVSTHVRRALQAAAGTLFAGLAVRLAIADAR